VIKEDMAESLANIETRLASVEELLAKRLRYDAAKEQAFDTLYAKMKQYEGDFQASLKRELLRSLLLLHDSMVQAEEAFAGGAAPLGQPSPEARTRVEALREELLHVLYAQDVEPIPPPEPGAPLDRAVQQTLRTVPTDRPEEDGCVDRVVRTGFRWGQRLLRPQEVVLRRYAALADAGETSGGSEPPPAPPS
jgi:molecular chaperone GrpE (heat shock protein)